MIWAEVLQPPTEWMVHMVHQWYGINGPTMYRSAKEPYAHHRNLVLEHIATNPLAEGHQQWVVRGKPNNQLEIP